VVALKVYAALTFDDGYLSHYHIAKSLFEEGIKGTFFIITRLKHFEGEPLLTLHPKLIRAINDMGHEIGSHSCTHPNLVRLSESDLEYELRKSKEFLSDLLKEDIVGFAYPGGFHDKRVVAKVSKYYEYARLAGKRFESKSWNAHNKCKYLIEGIGAKELLKLPLKLILYRDIKPVVIFHDDPLWVIKSVVKYLRFYGARFVTLSELANSL